MRIELIHPMVVHFPIVFLITGSIFRWIDLFLKKRRLKQMVLFSSWILLFLGVCTAWLAVLAGEFAEDIVRDGLCKPEIVEDHKDLAYTTAILFTFALICDFGRNWIKNRGLALSISIIVPVLYLVGAVILVLTGGYGGDLVYEQGAAVQKICD